MAHPTNRLFCRLDGLTPAAREQQRLNTLESLGLLHAENIPVFEEATQTAAHFTQTPIAWLSLVRGDYLELKTVVGLHQMGLMNDLAKTRSLPLQESYCQYAIDSQHPFIINDLSQYPILLDSILFQYYGIRAYLGIPLLTQNQVCIGTLAVFDQQPHEFSTQEVEFLNLTARWCLSEYERDMLAQHSPQDAASDAASLPRFSSPRQRNLSESPPPETAIEVNSSSLTKTEQLKVNLLVQLSSELRSPLTSVMGMARMLEQQLYGPLTQKQKEYVEIIHNSGQKLLLVVEEMVTLGVLDEHNAQLNLSSADVEMVCQQSLTNLESLAQQNQQSLTLSIEPGNRIWLLDKEKIRQALYYLVYSLVQSADVGSEIHVHVSRKVENPIDPMPILTISVWATHPWLDNNLPSTGLESATLDNLETAEETAFPENPTLRSLIKSLKVEQRSQKAPEEKSREVLGLLLSCHLTEMHGGKIIIQGSPEIGYRYVFKIPQIEKQLDN